MVCKRHIRGVHKVHNTHKAPNAPVFLGYHWLPLATIDLVGDNREFRV